MTASRAMNIISKEAFGSNRAKFTKWFDSFEVKIDAVLLKAINKNLATNNLTLEAIIFEIVRLAR